MLHLHKIRLACMLVVILSMGPVSHILSSSMPRTISVTVFMHGSVFSILSLLNMRHVYHDRLTDDLLYVSLVKKVRNNPILQHDQLFFEQGPCAIDSAIIDQFWCRSFDNLRAQQAANFIVPTYDYCNKLVHNNSDVAYYSYGHLGLLSQNYRASVAVSLYQWLIDVQDYYAASYDKVAITLVGHSHAGGICLGLAKQEALHKKGLVIDNVVLYGAPVQVETASYAYAPMFRRVLNCYAEADIVQVGDWLSTSRRRSYQKLSDVRVLKDRPEVHGVYDIRLLVNNRRFRINHANMWLMGRSSVGCKNFDPLPIMVLTPLLIDLVERCPIYHNLDCNIIDTRQQCAIMLCLSDHTQSLITSMNVYNGMKTVQNIVRANWRPDDRSRWVAINKKTIKAIFAALKQMRTDGKE